MHDNDRLQVPSRLQELGDHVSSGRQATSYDKSDRRFSATMTEPPRGWIRRLGSA
jgi:hypothetical protein